MEKHARTPRDLRVTQVTCAMFCWPKRVQGEWGNQPYPSLYPWLSNANLEKESVPSWKPVVHNHVILSEHYSRNSSLFHFLILWSKMSCWTPHPCVFTNNHETPFQSSIVLPFTFGYEISVINLSFYTHWICFANILLRIFCFFFGQLLSFFFFLISAE